MKAVLVKLLFSFFTLIFCTAVNAIQPDIPHTENWLFDKVKEVIPSDPGIAGESTRSGIDSDSDGIRDDVELFIFNTYSEEKQIYLVNSLLNIASFLQTLMISTEQNPRVDLIFTASYMVPKQCIVNDFDSLTEARRVASKVEAKMLNTLSRTNRYFELMDVLDKEFERSIFLIEYYKRRGALKLPSCTESEECTASWDVETIFCRGNAEYQRNDMSANFH